MRSLRRSVKAWVINATSKHAICGSRIMCSVGKIPGSLNKADMGTKHVARDDLLRHIRALGLREWQAPDESPRDVSTITNRLSMMWPRIFSGRCTPKF